MYALRDVPIRPYYEHETHSWKLCNELVESKPIFNGGTREKIEELYERIRYILIYFYKIGNGNNKNINCCLYKHSRMRKATLGRLLTEYF